jgi:dimethylhistidine N-methyltransferase
MTSVRLEVQGAVAPDDVVAGLMRRPRRIPCKYFYDERGATLFEEICRLDEYYPTRTEIGILARYRHAIRDWVGKNARIIEYGSGSGEKTRLLLDHLDGPHEYVPIDICLPQLIRNAESLRRAYAGLRVRPLHGDYSRPLPLPANGKATRTIVFFPGSTIGNFEPLEAAAFLRHAAQSAGSGGGLLIGVDLKKPVEILERAYNDARGVTAAFNLNMLVHLNALCNADFAPTRFEHVAFYDGMRRIEMHLRSLMPQRVTVRGAPGGPLILDLRQGELVQTEHCYKYDVDEFSDLVRSAGFESRHTWLDAKRWFGVFAFDVAAGLDT